MVAVSYFCIHRYCDQRTADILLAQSPAVRFFSVSSVPSVAIKSLGELRLPARRGQVAQQPAVASHAFDPADHAQRSARRQEPSSDSQHQMPDTLRRWFHLDFDVIA